MIQRIKEWYYRKQHMACLTIGFLVALVVGAIAHHIFGAGINTVSTICPIIVIVLPIVLCIREDKTR